jgi:hypothetical protein
MEVSGEPHALMFCFAASAKGGRVDLRNGTDTRKENGKSLILRNFFGLCYRIARLCCGT